MFYGDIKNNIFQYIIFYIAKCAAKRKTREPLGQIRLFFFWSRHKNGSYEEGKRKSCKEYSKNNNYLFFALDCDRLKTFDGTKSVGAVTKKDYRNNMGIFYV